MKIIAIFLLDLRYRNRLTQLPAILDDLKAESGQKPCDDEEDKAQIIDLRSFSIKGDQKVED